MGRGKATPLIIEGIDYRKSKTCSFCFREYFKKILTNEKNWIKSKFCSNECRNKSRVGNPFPHNRRKMTEDEKQKGHELNRWWGWNKGFKHSKEAKIKMSITRQKILKEQWQGFKTNSDRLERSKFRREIQKLVFERDNFTCQICGEKGKKLQVDHIQPWSEYVKLRFDLNNCRTLCMSCHYKITFGRDIPEGVTAWGHNLSKIGG